MLRFIKTRRSAEPTATAARNKPNGIVPNGVHGIPEVTEETGKLISLWGDN